jgi:hypothetical protein
MADVMSLNESIAQKKAEKYDSALEVNVRKWLGELVNRSDEFNNPANALEGLLKDGVVLCEYVCHQSAIARVCCCCCCCC